MEFIINLMLFLMFEKKLKHHMKKLFAGLILSLGCSVIAFGQSSLRLKAQDGVYQIQEGNFSDLTVGSRAFDDAEQKFFGILHYAEIPSAQEVEDLKKQGVEFDYVLPVRAYMVSIPLNNLNAVKRTTTASAFYAIPTATRMSARMRNKEFPDWMWVDGGKAEIQLSVFRGADWNNRVQRITAAGFELISYDSFSGTLLVRGFLPKVDDLMHMPFVQYIHETDEPGQPENYEARSSHRVAAVQQTHPTYDGRGVVLGIGDDGDIGPHIDYQGRIIVNKSGQSNGNHGDHVTGTAFGAGNLESRATGMAPGADLAYYNYPDNLDDVDGDYATYGVRITNSSYSNGCNAGYTSRTNNMDNDAIQNRSLLHVFSAGNSGTSNCGYGAGSGWGNITGGHKAGKNVIATANIMKDDVLANSSSRGPASDGRIKPEIAAVGTSVYSCNGGNIYNSSTGTSMAAPGAAGALAVMYSAYKQNNGNMDPAGGLMKAVMMNTADDMGNPGPDFLYGFGRINILNAVDVIENNHYMMDTISNGQSNTHSIVVPGNVSQLKVMLYWTDPAASPTAQTALINDLDFSMQFGGAGTTWQPWVLDPTPNAAALNSNAVRGTDTLNNVEQITLDDPSAGTYTLDVNATNIPLGVQEYFITYQIVLDEIRVDYPFGGESMIPFTSEQIRWTAPSGTGNFTIEFSGNNGQTWSTLSSSVSSNDRIFNWNGLPNLTTHEALIRVTRGSQSATSDPFSLFRVPDNISVAAACPDSMLITWNAVPGATHYDVLILGAKYMDSVTTSSTNVATVYNVNPYVDQWISVRARKDSTIVGRRADAVLKSPGLINCSIQDDIELQFITSPSRGMQDCQSSSFIPSLRVKNEGVNMATNFDLWISYTGAGGPLSQMITITDTLMAGQVMDYSFNNPWSFASGLYNVSAAVSYSNDDNPFNDSLETDVLVSFSSGTQSFPYANTLDGFINCPTASNCDQTTCILADGFQNISNNVVGGDNIDWRTNSGPTPSNNTGPSADYSTGTASGNYLYLEASNGCELQEAILSSPCVDLSGSTLPKFRFWYHMYGADVGELHVDLIADGRAYFDIVPALVGDQGNQWRSIEIDLTPFVGDIVNIQIRGITGPGFASDIAIDHFEWLEINSAPSVDFTPNTVSACLNQAVGFTDISTNSPTQWEWKFFPNTVSFVNGTSANSQNPSVEFSAFGTYDIRLIATNTFGSDSVDYVGAVNILAPVSSISEDFENIAVGFPSPGFEIVNPDNDDTWQRELVLGSTGAQSRTISVENFNYNAAGQEDWFVTPQISMPATGNMYLKWDLAYAYYSNTFSDALEIRVSTDCGTTFSNVIYSQSGSSLATAGQQTNNWSPNAASDWRTDSLDLSNFLGQDISIAFVNINGYGNNIYIDNINVYDPAVSAPVASISQSDTAVCGGVPVNFSMPTPSGGVTYNWDFGPGASPATAVGAGPHTVTYSTGGNKTISLSASNTGGQATANSTLDVTPATIANFAYTQGATYLDYNFTSSSTGGGNISYSWDFGDGNNSNIQNPSHSYAGNGTYIVTLTVDADCGQDVMTDTLEVNNIGLQEFLNLSWLLYPNPAKERVTVDLSGTNQAESIILMDLQGRVLRKVEVSPNDQSLELNIDELSQGVYLIELMTSQGRSIKRFQKS